MSIVREFKEFALKGNVMDLAVGVIIGAAFGKIVDSIVKDLINPILGLVVGKPNFDNLYLILKAPAKALEGPETYETLVKAGASVFGFGAFLTIVVNFAILAFIVFWMVKTMNRIKRQEPPPPPAPTPEDTVLLRAIRDSLKK